MVYISEEINIRKVICVLSKELIPEISAVWALIQTPVKECHQYATLSDPSQPGVTSIVQPRKPAEPNSPVLNIINLNRNLPLNSSQNRMWLPSVCAAAASLETNLLHFGAWAVWNGVDSVNSATGAVPIKAAWCYPAARPHFNSSTPSWLLPEYLGVCAEASWGLGLTRDGNLRRPQTQSSFSLFFFLHDEEVGASSLSTTPGSSSNPNFCLFFYHPHWQWICLNDVMWMEFYNFLHSTWRYI